ncbi:uncharacterized protein Z520_11322 [Fonsecaea multimorphosa CBS 102226]|uniref:Zn(2)-C6 fungal-type domain-containing protein n=1 Tax=Fonsecaea multimorphosa CBS 102226 TaxID=1442371 RepID=A0A0D2JRH2_9EURO|nr:uncharacterized protein Z520_11322 [Fonsecaea multimorphosa CBS 102226]KIX93049.1 hypothetical protein Z520_11322 [Fonsecaea multimorphosa CBS 102226]OAL18296.1 hypothetical protein AYO22_10874 [Fonsecaea multimorphosa]
MFFIVPERKGSNPPASPASDNPAASPPQRKRQRLSPEPEEISGYYPKRTPKACDRCRLKKARCQWNAGKICDKCKRDGVICTTNRESKREPKPPNAAYVQLVESQRDCLLRAVSKIVEGGLSNDPAAMAKMLQELGISVQDLKRAPREGVVDDPTTNLDDADIYENAAEIQALLDDWTSENTDIQKHSCLSTLVSRNFGTSPSYFDSPLHTEYQSGATQTVSYTAADATSTLDATFLPSLGTDDWLAFDGCADNWSLPFSESRIDGVKSSVGAG